MHRNSILSAVSLALTLEAKKTFRLLMRSLLRSRSCFLRDSTNYRKGRRSGEPEGLSGNASRSFGSEVRLLLIGVSDVRLLIANFQECTF